jgi:hypothetical protein
MEQSPSSEADRFVASQEIPRVLLNQKVHYRIHKIHNVVSPTHRSPLPQEIFLVLISVRG